MVVHANELGPAMQLRRVNRLGRADITDLACLYHVGKGLQRLLDRGCTVEAVDLIEIST